MRGQLGAAREPRPVTTCPFFGAAPEVLRGGPYAHAADWWSLGVLLFAMATGQVRTATGHSPPRESVSSSDRTGACWKAPSRSEQEHLTPGGRLWLRFHQARLLQTSFAPTPPFITLPCQFCAKGTPGNKHGREVFCHRPLMRWLSSQSGIG